MSGDGMSGFVNQLISPTSGTALTSSTLWAEVTAAAPLIVTIFVFAFGYRIVRRVLNGGSKAKLKI